ncbi:translation elongation factor ef-1 [Niveomyces insectorum RCEF 264]|uniref:Elongation factor 1 alpha-like protein n=1 Tax=Niveomyces insectorum RCEF 264 TaxID=1081102 RepID=A0A167TYN0_9HYPO|nr:translation elongation factor ef-1 [Niveomyces insectorum RCEF 264]
MSRHQLYRNYDYENDLQEFDGLAPEDGGEELDPEDRELMNDATAEVRRVLDDQAGKVTESQIQEALWHYYYDVDKSVAYLRKTFIDPRPQPAKKAKPKQDSQDERPRLGLLGGASAPPKMSKLQALAAQRKRKAEEAKKSKESGSVPGEDNKADADVGELRSKAAKLALESGDRASFPGGSSAATPESAQTQADSARETRSTAAGFAQVWPPGIQTPQNVPLAGTGFAASDVLPMEGLQGPDGAPAQEPQSEAPLLAEPSAFAQALFGPKETHAAHEPDADEFLPIPSLFCAPGSVLETTWGPSPDDVVLEAQAKAWKQAAEAKTPKKNVSNGGVAKGDASLAAGVKTLQIDDTPLPKSKHLDVLAEYKKSNAKKSASFVVVGHVDAGKSTMMGRLLLELKLVEKRQIDKFQKEADTMGKSSFALAWVFDQGSDEREHGVTIDIATRRFETDKTAFTILDAPGHRDFIPNMIAGTSQADFAILVVDASTGAFESGLKGQTREHALLMRSMGVSRIIVAVNKLDTVAWSQARFDEIVHQVSGFLSATGFQLKNVSFVPVSGLKGDNLVAKSTDPAAAWYAGTTLMEELEKSEPLARALDKPLRLPISEAYKTAASAVTVAGRIEAGSLQLGDALLVLPANEKAYVKSLSRDGEPAEWAVAGQNVVLNLANIDAENVKVGDVICDPAKPVKNIDAFSMKALAFDIFFPMAVDVHRGRLSEPAMITELTALLDKSTGKVTKRKPPAIKPGSVARIKLQLNSKVPLESGQRVVLRTNGRTVAAGLLE